MNKTHVPGVQRKVQFSVCSHFTTFLQTSPSSGVVQIKLTFLCSLNDSGLLSSSLSPNFERLSKNLT